MDALQRTFLSMIKTVLWNDPFVIEDNIMPTALFHEASRYKLIGLLSSHLDLFCKNAQETRYKWSACAMADYSKNFYFLESHATLCRILAEENIKPVFLKGLAAAYYYPNPLLRQMGDIDFMVPPEQYKACCKLMKKNGYVRGIDGGRHQRFEKNGIEYECHRYFSLNMSAADTKKDQLLYDGCRRCVARSIEGKAYYALPDEEHGIALLEHLKHHLYDGVGFRQIIDWVVYADAVLDDTCWALAFQQKAQQCGLERLAKTVTRTAQLYLGLRTENRTWCSDVEDLLCEEFIDYIFSCNNFGFVQEENETVHIMGDVFRGGFFSYLNASAIYHIPIAKRVVVLRPLAWLYQIVRWCIKGSIGLLSKKDSTKIDMGGWDKQNKLLKDLGA